MQLFLLNKDVVKKIN